MDNAFERLVKDINSAGLEWVEAKLKADQLEADQKPFLSSIKNNIERGRNQGETFSETKIERLALGSKEYRDYVVRVCSAVAESLRKKVRYESLQALFEAKRSEGALTRVKIEKGIVGQGG